MSIENSLINNGFLNNCLNACTILREDIGVKMLQLGGRHFVYLLRNEGEIVYVGRTSSLYSRMTYHKMDKSFSDVLLIEYSSNDVRLLEKKIVKFTVPALNRCWVK